MANFDNSAQVAIDLTYKFLKERMEAMGISQYRLSKLTGISEGSLSGYFNKVNEMSLSNYFKICGALELQPYLVAKEDGDEMPNRINFN